MLDPCHCENNFEVCYGIIECVGSDYTQDGYIPIYACEGHTDIFWGGPYISKAIYNRFALLED